MGSLYCIVSNPEDLEGIITVDTFQSRVRKSMNSDGNRENEKQGNHLENGQTDDHAVVYDRENACDQKESTIQHVSHHRGNREHFFHL